MSLRKKLTLYIGILIIVAGCAGGYVIYDFVTSPYPPDIPLEKFQPVSMLATPHHLVSKPKFPVIDVHSHPKESKKNPDQLVQILDESGIAAIVDLNGGWDEGLKRTLENYSLKYPNRFVVFTNPDFRKINNPDFGEDQVAQLERAVAIGAKGVKIWKDLGLELRDSSGKLIAVDDPRLDPLWAKAGELGVPVLMHTAEPSPFWDPIDRYNERYEDLMEASRWEYFESLYDPKFPKKETLLRQRENIVRRHPGTIFIGAHMGELGNDLKELGRMFDHYPNFYVDLSDRVYELGRQPYTTREFFIKYQDRILFGIDLYPETHVYQVYYRFFETFDEYFDYPRYYYKHGRWKIYGIHLPDRVLRKIYYENAARLLKIDPAGILSTN